MKFILMIIFFLTPTSVHADSFSGALIGGMLGSSSDQQNNSSTIDPKPCWVTFQEFHGGGWDPSDLVLDVRRITDIELEEGYYRETVSQVCIGYDQCRYIYGTPTQALIAIKNLRC